MPIWPTRCLFPVLSLVALLPITCPARTDEAKAPAHKMTQAKSYVTIDSFYTTIYDAGRPVGMLMVAIGLDISDNELRTEADRGMPFLRDCYLRSLANFAATAVHPWEQPSVEEIAGRLQHVTDNALHRKGAKVLLAQVAIRVSR